MKKLTLCIATIPVLLAGSATAAAPDNVTISSITYAGSGCPAGSVAENLSDDMQAFTLLFDQFYAEGGYGLDPSDSRKNCQITVGLDFPQGWSVSLATLDYRGYASLDPGVLGTQKTEYYFQGEEAKASFQTQFAGYFDDDYEIRDALALDALVWSPCGENIAVNINAQVKVVGGDHWSGGLMTLDSVDGTVKHKYGLQWKRCDGGVPDGPGRPGDGDDDDDGRPGDITHPANVSIDSIIYAGTGCPQGTVAENVSDDAQAFTLLFDSYVAEIGPGISRRENRKNCNLLIDLHYPQGWSFALATFDYRGYASMDHNVTALQQSEYYFQGERGALKFETDFRGVIDEDYQVRDTLPLASLTWSPCGQNRALNIHSEVRLNNTRNRRGTGLMTVDSIDGKVHQTYGLVWRRCP